MTIMKGRASKASETQRVRVGDVGPDFELSGHFGKDLVRLGDFKGRKHVVLVFYPLDWTGV